jgi:hypothetical protein
VSILDCHEKQLNFGVFLCAELEKLNWSIVCRVRSKNFGISEFQALEFTRFRVNVDFRENSCDSSLQSASS